MRRLLLASISAAVLLLSPSVARADDGSAAPAVGPPNPMIYCTPGHPNACFAAGFQSSSGTFMFWLQNLQGSVSADPTPWGINRIVIRRRADEELMLFGWGRAVTEGITNGVEPAYAEDSYGSDPLNGVQTRTYYGVGPGFLGCDGMIVDPEYGPLYPQTCPREGLTGWVRFPFGALMYSASDYGAQRPLTAEDISITVSSNPFSPVGCSIVGAASGMRASELLPACEVLPYSALTTVPEPTTLALTAGGLALLGLAGRQRRS